MNIFQSIDTYLSNNVAEYKAEAKRVGNIAAEDSTLSPYELEQLTFANAKAQASLQMRNVISQSIAYSRAPEKDEETAQREALPRIVRAIEDQMDIALRNKETHIATLQTFSTVLRSIRLVEGDAAAVTR